MRYILLDRITELCLDAEKPYARGTKCVTLSEEYLADHFPGAPIFPGALMIEAAAQLSGVLVEEYYRTQNSVPRDSAIVSRAVLAQVKDAKFYAAIRPGDQIKMECVMVSLMGNAAHIHATLKVEEQTVSAIQLLFTLVEVGNSALNQHREQLFRLWTENLQSLRGE